MSPNRLSTLFFAAASLIFGGTLAALVVRTGAPAFAAIEQEPATFAGVVAGSSSRSPGPAPVMIASAPEVPAPAVTAAPAPRCAKAREVRVVHALRSQPTPRAEARTCERVVVRVHALHRDEAHVFAPSAEAWAAAHAEKLVLVNARVSRTLLRNTVECARTAEAAARARIPTT